MSDQPLPRTRFEIEADILYAITLHDRHVRLYRRIRGLVAFFSLLAGAGALHGALDQKGMLVTVLGITVAALSIFDQVCDFAGSISAHATKARLYRELLAKAKRKSIGDPELDACRLEAEIDGPTELETLRWPAQNSALRTLGHNDAVQALSMREWLMDKIA
jgi:hypothetical protein